MNERDVSLRDGRTLRIYDNGDPNGNVVVLHHGTPGSGIWYRPDLEQARERGLRVISYDRAGYGGSSPKPGRAVVDIADDVVDVLETLGVDRFATGGGSGGAPHALAIGARLGDRCVGVVAIACPTPREAEDIDWLAGQGEQNVQEWAAAAAGPDELEAYLEGEAADLRAATAEEIKDVLASVLPPVDAAVLTGDRAKHSKETLDWAVSPGVAGWRDDDLAFSKPWGFGIEEIRVPVLLWQGVQDLMVPVAHGRWLAERIPGVEAHISEEDGHLSIVVGRLTEIYDWIAARF